MRLDKYLKVTRLIKRRPIAKEACDSGRVSINGKVAKAGSEVKVDDVIEIEFAQKKLTAKVTGIRETVRKEEVQDLYEIMTGQPID